jgi:hypothetical protein
MLLHHAMITLNWIVIHSSESEIHCQLHSNVINYITITLQFSWLHYIMITSIFKCNRLNYNYFVNVIDYITDIFIHSETSRIARTRMTHLFKESETRQCEGSERKQGDVVIDESGDIQCIFFLLTRRLKVTNNLNISRYSNIDKVVHSLTLFQVGACNKCFC